MRLQADTKYATVITGRYKRGWCILCTQDSTYGSKFIIGNHIPYEVIPLIRMCYNLDHQHWVRK